MSVGNQFMQDTLLSVGVCLGFSCILSMCCRARRHCLLQQQLQQQEQQTNVPSNPLTFPIPTAPPAPVALQGQPQYVVYMPPQIYDQQPPLAQPYSMRV